jgi:glutamate 5-kinase
MKYYKDLFRERGISVAQILLTHHNFATRKERDTITQIARAYIARAVVPIINENDMVDKEEFEYHKSFSDNDILAALVGVNLGVDMAVLLTDVEGLHASDPKHDADADLIHDVAEVTPEIEALAGRDPNKLGLGGMGSKLAAARTLTEAGIPTLIASGRHALGDIIGGSAPRTRFHPQEVGRV